MNASISPLKAARTLLARFDGFLKKPFHVKQVIEAIEDAMAVVY